MHEFQNTFELSSFDTHFDSVLRASQNQESVRLSVAAIPCSRMIMPLLAITHTVMF